MTKVIKEHNLEEVKEILNILNDMIKNSQDESKVEAFLKSKIAADPTILKRHFLEKNLNKTLLRMAVEDNNIKLAQLLIDMGADVNASIISMEGKNKVLSVPIMFKALKQPDLSMYSLLLKNNADTTRTATVHNKLKLIFNKEFIRNIKKIITLSNITGISTIVRSKNFEDSELAMMQIDENIIAKHKKDRTSVALKTGGLLVATAIGASVTSVLIALTKNPSLFGKGLQNFFTQYKPFAIAGTVLASIGTLIAASFTVHKSFKTYQAQRDLGYLNKKIALDKTTAKTLHTDNNSADQTPSVSSPAID